MLCFVDPLLVCPQQLFSHHTLMKWRDITRASDAKYHAPHLNEQRYTVYTVRSSSQMCLGKTCLIGNSLRREDRLPFAVKCEPQFGGHCCSRKDCNHMTWLFTNLSMELTSTLILIRDRSCHKRSSNQAAVQRRLNTSVQISRPLQEHS